MAAHSSHVGTPDVGAEQADQLRPAEFCALERQLIAGMSMRKKRNVKMEPMQQLKLQLLERVESTDPEIDGFTAALAEAVLVVSAGPSTGPAQAVASDLQMDWTLACSSPGFVAWLRHAAAGNSGARAAFLPHDDT